MEMPSRNALGLALVLALASRAGAQAARPAASRPTATRRAATRADSTHVARPAPHVGRDSARTLVLARMRSATVISQRLMMRNGHQVYSFRVREKGKSETVRVIVDAMTGDVSR
jgi:uncharacterized membrane protein YkoI